MVNSGAYAHFRNARILISFFQNVLNLMHISEMQENPEKLFCF